MKYLHWKETTIEDFSPENVKRMYEEGFVFTRISKGVMQQTRSVRIDLSKFEPSSENRRIIKKTEPLEIALQPLPLSQYDYKLGKQAKDFYETKFGTGIMSAQKVKEMLTDQEKSNFNSLMVFKPDTSREPFGYTICYSSSLLLHYSYPFYDLQSAPKDMGLGMMTRALIHCKNAGMKHVYLGSLQRPSDTYKLQFSGLEWFDGEKWQDDMEAAKNLLRD